MHRIGALLNLQHLTLTLSSERLPLCPHLLSAGAFSYLQPLNDGESHSFIPLTLPFSLSVSSLRNLMPMVKITIYKHLHDFQIHILFLSLSKHIYSAAYWSHPLLFRRHAINKQYGWKRNLCLFKFSSCQFLFCFYHFNYQFQIQIDIRLP